MHIGNTKLWLGLAAIATVLMLLLVLGTFAGTERASAQEGDTAFTPLGAGAADTHWGGAVRAIRPSNQSVIVLLGAGGAVTPSGVDVTIAGCGATVPAAPVIGRKHIWTWTDPAFPNKCKLDGAAINVAVSDTAAPGPKGILVLNYNSLALVGWTWLSPKTPAGEAEGPAGGGDFTLNDGSLAGVSDIVVGSVNTGAGLFYCIVKTDHNSTSNQVVTALQCNIDIEGAGIAPTTNTPPSWGDTCLTLSERIPSECDAVSALNNELNNPSETGADAIAGPPPPPPYTNLQPSIGIGEYYPTGAGSPDGVCGTTDCTVVTSCFRDVGPIKGTGPNIISTAVLLDPKNGVTIQADTDGDTVKDTQVDQVSSGTVDIWYNQDNDSCAAFTAKGDPDFSGLPLQSIQVNDKGGTNINPNPAPWRPGPKPGATTIDFDGDGCTDEQELDINNTSGKCGDDPQNPSDSFSDANTVDLSGVYDILVVVTQGNCTNDQCTSSTGAEGVYFFCRSDIQHDPEEVGSNDIEVRIYCYTDTLASEINPEAYPGITGDGMAGAPPPGPQDGSGSYAYGDVGTFQTVLNGTFNKTTNNFEISGCFENEDGQSNLGNFYVELTASAHQRPGKVDIWLNEVLADCQNGTPDGAPTFPDANLSTWQANPNKGKGYDQDDDGVPTERELQDDIACGRRDPYNKNDYYDVSIPRDGVIDLPNDILGVILHFAPGGYPPGDENWDRPPVMAGSGLGSTWNRGTPDGVIDLPNDILGVILQFNPGGCPPLS